MNCLTCKWPRTTLSAGHINMGCLPSRPLALLGCTSTIPSLYCVSTLLFHCCTMYLCDPSLSYLGWGRKQKPEEGWRACRVQLLLQQECWEKQQPWQESRGPNLTSAGYTQPTCHQLDSPAINY